MAMSFKGFADKTLLNWFSIFSLRLLAHHLININQPALQFQPWAAAEELINYREIYWILLKLLGTKNDGTVAEAAVRAIPKTTEIEK